jgi:peptidoglycan hydrolase-like protein with peptidoglycan-binding domain
MIELADSLRKFLSQAITVDDASFTQEGKGSGKMSSYKRFLLLGCTLFTAVLLLIDLMASPVFAAPQAPHEATTPATSLNGCPPTLSIGSSGTWVQVLQYRLNAFYERGNFGNSPSNFSPPLNPDGSFGALTQAAVEDFQGAAALQPDGSVGPNTWSALGFCAATTHYHLLRGQVFMIRVNCPPSMGEGGNNNPIWVMALQSRLNNMYYLNFFSHSAGYLVVDGSFGPSTKQMVIDFQLGYLLGQNPGAAVNGLVDQETWTGLGLCF